MQNTYNLDLRTPTNQALLDLQKASFLVMFGIGLLFILLKIFGNSTAYSVQINILEKSFDLPFAFVATVYFLATLRLALPQVRWPYFNHFLVAVGTLFMFALIYINFFLADK